MERTAPLTTKSQSQGLISQNLTVEQLKKKRKPLNMEVRLGSVKSKGAFGTVYTADIFQKTQKKVAMKVIRREERGQIQEIDQYNLIEIEIMSQIDNPHINKLIEYYFQVDEKTNQEELVLLQPLAICDLSKFLEGMPEKEAIEFLAQIAIGTKGMHDKKVIHRDLNPRNILVFKNDQRSALNNLEFLLKISDFGGSKILGYDQSRALTQQVGKINYMAPEQLNNSVQGYKSGVDIFALGLTIFQMISGKVFNASDITSRNFKAQQYSSEFIELLYKLCSLDYQQRPSVDQLIEHPIIQKSSAFIGCLLHGIVPFPSSKIKSAIDYLQNLQKQEYTVNSVYRQYEAQEKLIEDLQKKFPSYILQDRLKKPLKQSIPEIGRIFYQMKRVRTEYKDQESEWQALYEIAIGNNDKQYFTNKYLGESNLKNDEKLRILNECSFLREINASGDIFIGFYKDDSRFYGRCYERDTIKEGHLGNGIFQGEISEYGINVYGDYFYYDGDYVDDYRNGYVNMDQAHIIGVMVASMKDNTLIIRDMVMEQTNMLLVMLKKEHGKMIKNMENLL
eukprot:403343024